MLAQIAYRVSLGGAFEGLTVLGPVGVLERSPFSMGYSHSDEITLTKRATTRFDPYRSGTSARRSGPQQFIWPRFATNPPTTDLLYACQ